MEVKSIKRSATQSISPGEMMDLEAHHGRAHTAGNPTDGRAYYDSTCYGSVYYDSVYYGRVYVCKVNCSRIYSSRVYDGRAYYSILEIEIGIFRQL